MIAFFNTLNYMAYPKYHKKKLSRTPNVTPNWPIRNNYHHFPNHLAQIYPVLKWLRPLLTSHSCPINWIHQHRYSHLLHPIHAPPRGAGSAGPLGPLRAGGGGAPNSPAATWYKGDFQHGLPSGNLSYWTCPFIVSFPIKNCDFPWGC